MKIDVPFAYQVEPVKLDRHGWGGPRSFRRSRQNIEVPELSRSDLPLAFTCKASSDRFELVTVPYRLHNGQLVRPILTETGQEVTPELLLELCESPGNWNNGLLSAVENPFFKSRYHWRDWAGAHRAMQEGDASSDFLKARSARIADLQSVFSRCLLVDGMIYWPTVEPVWAIQVFENGVHVQMSVDADYSKPAFAFRIDDNALRLFAQAAHRSLGYKIPIASYEETADIVRFDHVSRDPRELLCDGFFGTFLHNFGEFASAVRPHYRNLWDEIASANDEIDAVGCELERLPQFVELFERVAQSPDMFDPAAFKSKEQGKRHKRYLDLFKAADAALEDLKLTAD